MELRHLRYFRAAAEAMHMGRAADLLHIAQPALSIQIQALESELGVALFVRKKRGIFITDAGSAFLQDTNDILNRVERAKRTAQNFGSGAAGVLRIGFTESASFSPIVTQALKSFRDTWPAVRLVLEEAVSDRLADAVEQGSLELAFVRSPTRARHDLLLESLASEPMVVAMARDHRLAQRSSVGLAELAGEDFVVRGQLTGMQAAVQAACREAGFLPHIAQQAPQLSAVINLLAASLGIAIVPECMKVVRPEQVAYIPIDDLPVRAGLDVLHREDSSTPAVRFIQIARLAVNASRS